MTHEERVQCVANAIEKAFDYLETDFVAEAKAAITASDATLEVTDEMIKAAIYACSGAFHSWHLPGEPMRNALEAALKVM